MIKLWPFGRGSSSKATHKDVNSRLPNTITLTPEGGEISSMEVAHGTHHTLLANCDADNGDIYLDFSTRRAMYDFAVSLLHESVFGKSGHKEYFPLSDNGGEQLVVDGARMREHSARLFISYENANSALPTTITVTPEGDETTSPEVAEGTHHTLAAKGERDTGDITLEFSTRRALYDFALSLLHESIFGWSAPKEFYPLSEVGGEQLVVNGARMTADSSRLFVFYKHGA